VSRGCAACSEPLGVERLEAEFLVPRDPVVVCSASCSEAWEERQRVIALALDGEIANPIVAWILVRD
jgi:hypothetical protein